jgi:hypothetical protein
MSGIIFLTRHLGLYFKTEIPGHFIGRNGSFNVATVAIDTRLKAKSVVIVIQKLVYCPTNYFL